VLEELAERFGSTTVLLGHTLDDQAETVLLGLARGSGARSLSGMRRGFDVFRRPLLDLTRDQTESACRAEGIEWWEDPHNHDPRFLRSRVRHRVLPVLEEELGPGVASALSRTADLLADDAAALDGLADDLRDAALRDGGLDTTVLAGWPAAIVTRAVRSTLVRAGCPASELTRGHVLAVVGLAPGKQVQLPGRVVAFLEGDLVRLGRTPVGG
jgi:tRNA(Ile)-lysidine synthase